MSDELIDGRDLRSRKPVRDNDADASQNEDQTPLPRAQNPEDAASGPYVVLEPPPEANPWLDGESPDTKPSIDTSLIPPPATDDALQEPAARVNFKPSGPQEFVPQFDTSTGTMPPVPDVEVEATRPAAQPDAPEPTREVQRQPQESAPIPEPYVYTSVPPSPPTTVHSMAEAEDTPDFIPMLHTPTTELPPVPEEVTSEDDNILDLIDRLREDDPPAGNAPPAEDSFIPMFHTPTSELPPVPDVPAETPPAPDQIMRLPRITGWDEDNEPGEPPTVEPPRQEPEATRPSVPTQSLKLPDFVPMLHTPTEALPPIEDEIEVPSEPAEEDKLLFDVPALDEDQPSDELPDYIPMFHTPTGELQVLDDEPVVQPRPIEDLYTSSTYEIVTGEYDNLDEAADDADYVDDVSRRLDALRADEQASIPAQRPPRARHGEKHTEKSGVADVVKAVGWRAIPLVLAIIAVVVLATVMGNRNRDNTGTSTPNSSGTADGVGSPTLMPGVVGADTQPAETSIAEDAATPTLAISPTPAAPYAQGRIAFASNLDGDFDIYVRDMLTEQQTRITDNAAADRMPAWSPDGTQLVFVSNLAGSDDLYLIGADGEGLVPLTNSESADHTPAWSPDGRSIIFSREDFNGSGIAKIDLACLTSSEPGACEEAVVLLTEGRYDLFPRWSSDGARIIFAASDIPGDPLRIAFMDPLGGSYSELGGTQTSDHSPALSPDGTRITFVSYVQGDDDLWLMGADGSGVLQLTKNSSTDTGPVWSPDGRYIVFGSDRSPTGDFDLYLIDLACLPDVDVCEQGVRAVTNDEVDSLDPAWTPIR